MRWLLVLVWSVAVASAAAPPPPSVGELEQTDNHTWIVRAPGEDRIGFSFPNGTGFVLDAADGLYVQPTHPSMAVNGSGRGWILPAELSDNQTAYMVTTEGPLSIHCHNATCDLTIEGETATLRAHKARPHTDIHGDGFEFDFEGGEVLANALAGFYWGTMLRSVIEKTLAKDYPVSSGYVISTLASQYQGTYPDVDHEFQIKGRVAIGSDTDLAIVRRMIELTLKLAREDPCQMWRAPCALQPSGNREYHVRRNSLDDKTNANMFEITGNVELMESIWLYVARTRDDQWLQQNIDDIEMVAWQIEWHMDNYGRPWTDVYYEDQVMKDGTETMSAALVARAFGILAQLEGRLGRNDMANKYGELSQLVSGTLVKPLPIGYWDTNSSRFVDWIDRAGLTHDHIHLLANILPAMFEWSTEEQSQSVHDMVEAEFDEFQRFPTFIAARIQDYNDTEQGVAGAYDLCAAGRYWCWDAAYWAWRQRGDVLSNQLNQVAEMGARDDYWMGERYDMDYVYYIDGQPWHGASQYYEYPCTYAWVLIHDFIGLQQSFDADVRITPRLTEPGWVTFNQSAYQLRYGFHADNFTLENLSNRTRTFQLELGALYPNATSSDRVVEVEAGAKMVINITEESVQRL